MQETLADWFCHLDISLAAEHGAYVRERGNPCSDWNQLGVVGTEWKRQVRPILQRAADRLPGSFVEEKHLSLGWHWRASDPELGRQRAAELIDTLTHLTANREIQVLQGNKVIEVRSGHVNKGVAGLHFLRAFDPDFILAIGDDWTDEDLFRAMPPQAFTVKVGPGRSAARLSVRNPAAVHDILGTLATLGG